MGVTYEQRVCIQRIPLLYYTGPRNVPAMGKSQKKRSMRRHNPVRVPDSHIPRGLAAASASSNKTEAVLPIIKKVRSPLFYFHLDRSLLICKLQSPTTNTRTHPYIHIYIFVLHHFCRIGC